MAKIVVERQKVIARPLDVVQAQFVDMQHHAKVGVHAALNVSEVRPQPSGCRAKATRRVLGTLDVDEIEVTRHPGGNSTLRSVAGSNEGLEVRQAFQRVDEGHTRVSLHVEVPLRGMRRWIAPLMWLGVWLDTVRALEEDRRDLEVLGYPR
ncbi:MAG TPA: hypothetical protein VL359_15565 [bacterium]|nr:hypothetical protein [bacterium]